jgi:2-keto-4-pentenoate hydratase/2-oxohepta-3-ene-1,7-dioic acid hydratase in catechol pathway
VRIASFEYAGAEHVGLVQDGALRPLPAGTRVLDLLAGAPAAAAGDPVALEAVRLLPPLTPPALRDFVAFEQHIEGAKKGVEGEAAVPAAWYEAPTFVFHNPHAGIGAHDDVPIPPGAELMDFECEVGAIVGRAIRDATIEQAHEAIVGYLIWNDWSARDIQKREMAVGLGPAKGKDFANTLGPWIVSADELEPYRRGDRLDLEMTVWVNDDRIGGDRLSSMAWSFEEMLAYASRGAWVGAGDVLGSGTCGGGALAEHWGRNGGLIPPPVRAGDVVRMTVEGIGTIANRLVPGAPAATEIPRARARGASSVA